MFGLEVNAYKILVEKPKVKRIILERFLWWSFGLNSSCLEQGPVVGSYEHGNEFLVSIKGGNFLIS